MNPEIFREYDIRGIVGDDLTAEGVETIGKGIGTFLRREYGLGEVVVGRDVRHSSKEFSVALMSGIRSCGLGCVDIGMVPTPLLYYAATRGGNDSFAGGVMITGSHNPPDFNGFKICHGQIPVFGQDIRDIRDLIMAGDFENGSGDLREMDVIEDYIEEVSSQIELKRTVRVVVDSGNGVAGPVAVPLLRKIGCEVKAIFDEPDGSFPNHHPDPTVVEYIQDLIGEVRGGDWELGIGYDGDADRIGAIDENGEILFGDVLTGIFAGAILDKEPGTIIFDVKCSQGLVEAIEQKGGTPLMWKTGHSNLKNKLRETGAPMAGEMSGHIFFNDRYYGYDDAIYASCRLVEILAAKEDVTLSSVAAEIPRYHSTPEIRIDCPDNIKFDVVEKMADRFRESRSVTDIDGARIDFPDGWGLIRASNTQPVLVLRFEGKSAEALAEIRAEVGGALREYTAIPPEVLGE